MAKTAEATAAEGRKNLPADMKSLIATVSNDITIPYYTDVLQHQDDTLISRGGAKGLKIYDEIERDTNAYAVLQKRKLKLTAREWTIEAASTSSADQKAADFIRDHLAAISFDRICTDLLDATLKGFAVSECVWVRDGAQLVPEQVVSHDQRRFVFDAQWQARLLTRENGTTGIELPERKFIVHRFGVRGNNPYGLGLGSRLFWPVLFKREGVAFWLTFLEKFASPTPVGKYPQGTPPNEQKKLLSSLLDMVQAGALVMPLGSEVEYLEATRAGTASYREWCEYWDRQMSLAVFGSTLATDTQGDGSRAASETHSDIEEDIIDADADLLAVTLRDQLFRWMVELNVPGAQPPLVRRLQAEDAHANEKLRDARTKNMKAEIDLLFEMKGKLPVARFVSVAGMMADEGLLPSVSKRLLAELSALPVPNSPPTLPPAADEVAGGDIANLAADHDHGVGALTNQLEAATTPVMEAWIDRLRREIDRAVDFDDLSRRLLAVQPELTLDPMGRLIATVSGVAELTGRSDVRDEIADKRKRR